MSDLPSPLEPYNPIHDPIHGRIWLTKVEMELVNTPEFQRLRRISQLSPADYVFPGSTHNRFCHSLGATHVMGLILGRPALQAHFKDRLHMIQILRLAALLHDIGHLPFSHVGEAAWNASRTVNWDEHRQLKYLTALDLVAASTPAAYHEELSATVVRSERISAIIDGHISRDHTGEGASGHPTSELVARIIKSIPTEADKADAVVHNLLSSELDCDRLDYLLRDSHAAGLTYGQADLWYLIENMIVVEDRHIGPVLAIDQKHGKLACEHYLLARYYHYAQLIGHKTVGAAELALGAAILELIRLEKLPAATSLQQAIAATGQAGPAFTEITDDRVLSLLSEVPRNLSGEPELIEYAQRVTERKLPKVIADDSGLQETKRPGEARAHPWDVALPKGHPEAKLAIADQCEVRAVYFSYSRRSRSLSGLDPGAIPAEVLEHGADSLKSKLTKAAKIAEPDGTPTPLLLHSPLVQAIASRRWATRRILALEPLDYYSGGGEKRRSAEFTRVKRFFDDALKVAPA